MTGGSNVARRAIHYLCAQFWYNCRDSKEETTMGTIIRLPSSSLGARLDVLRDFIDEAETENQDVLGADQEEELEDIVNYVWPGVVSRSPSCWIKLAFAWAGFAIGLGIHP